MKLVVGTEMRTLKERFFPVHCNLKSWRIYRLYWETVGFLKDYNYINFYCETFYYKRKYITQQFVYIRENVKLQKIIQLIISAVQRRLTRF